MRIFLAVYLLKFVYCVGDSLSVSGSRLLSLEDRTVEGGASNPEQHAFHRSKHTMNQSAGAMQHFGSDKVIRWMHIPKTASTFSLSIQSVCSEDWFWHRLGDQWNGSHLNNIRIYKGCVTLEPFRESSFGCHWTCAHDWLVVLPLFHLIYSHLYTYQLSPHHCCLPFSLPFRPSGGTVQFRG